MATVTQIDTARVPSADAAAEPSHRATSLVAFALLTAISTALLVGIGLRKIDPATAIVVHLLVLAAVAVSLVGLMTTSPPLATWVGLMGTLCTGPFGAAAAFAILAVLPSPRMAIDLSSWYERKRGVRHTDTAEAITNEISSGRALRPDLGQLRDFRRTIRDGTTTEKQALLGLIGLKYSPEYYVILRVALSSPEASVRVQAAAVFAKLREQFKVELREALGNAGDRDLHARLALVMSAIDSGFIDAREQRNARQRAKEVCRAILAEDPAALSAQLALARLELADDEYDAILARLSPLAARNMDAIETTLLEHYATALFRTGRTMDALQVQKVLRQRQRFASRAGAGPQASLASTDALQSGGWRG